MSKLRGWIEEQFGERKVDPNSALGQALRYVLGHWDGLTKFLTVAGAPLDNNVAERALKRAVLLRKNAHFYKNEHKALVGEILLSLDRDLPFERSERVEVSLGADARAVGRESHSGCLPAVELRARRTESGLRLFPN